MNTIQLLHRIKETASAIANLNDELLGGNKAPSALDKELLKQKCIELYDLVRTLHTSGEKSIPEIITPPVAEKINIMEAEVPPLSMESFEIKELALMSDQVPDAGEPLPEANTSVEPAPLSIEEKKEPATKPLPHVDEISLHEKISSGIRRGDVNERVKDAKVESLKTAITLNRKIAFVNELFKENTVEYAKAIERLNSSEGLNEAMRIFNELKHQYAWNNDNELVRDLEVLIQKRFG